MEKLFKNSKNSQYRLTYYFVFCPRYRRKIFKEVEVAHYFEKQLQDLATRMNWEINQLHIGEDYVYLALDAEPLFSPADLIGKIKNETSSEIRQHFHFLSHLPSLWSRTYLVSSDVLTEEMIQTYVAQQKKRG